MTLDQQPLLAYERAKRVLDEIGNVGAQYGVSSRDKEFLKSLVERQQRRATEGIAKWLGDIEHKVFNVGVRDA